MKVEVRLGFVYRNWLGALVYIVAKTDDDQFPFYGIELTSNSQVFGRYYDEAGETIINEYGDDIYYLVEEVGPNTNGRVVGRGTSFEYAIPDEIGVEI